MKKIKYIILLCLVLKFATGQNFEGRIIYSVTFQNNDTHKKDTSLSKGLGSVETFYIKNGDYLIKGNGQKKDWILYKSSTNKIYEKFKNNDTLYVTDASINNNSIKEQHHHKNAAKWRHENYETGKSEIIKCDEYVFITDQGNEYFYYNKKYKIDSKLFANHKHGHFGNFVALSNCIPLQINKNVGPYNCDWFAGDFVWEKIDDSVFKVPDNFVLKNK
jgi:hypothetical protein